MCTSQVKTPGEKGQCFLRTQRDNRRLGRDFTIVPCSGRDFGSVKSTRSEHYICRKARVKGKSDSFCKDEAGHQHPVLHGASEGPGGVESRGALLGMMSPS